MSNDPDRGAVEIRVRIPVYRIPDGPDGACRMEVGRLPDPLIASLNDMNERPGNDLIELCARGAHEMNRAWCIFIGDASQKPWDEAPDWQKVSCRDGVLGILEGNTPEQSHENWLRHKQATGWTYGPVKNEATKEHPAMMPYGDLPTEQKIKDHIYRDAVLALAKAYGNHPQ